MMIPTSSWFSRHLRGFFTRRAAATPRRLRSFVADSVRIRSGENAAALQREQARTLLANARFFSPIGLVTAGLMALDLPGARRSPGLAVCVLLVALYVAWLTLGQVRRRVSDLAFIRGSIGLLGALGTSWGALALLLTRDAIATGADLVTPTAIMMALVSAPMILAPVLAALAFWLPMTIASAIAIAGLMGAQDGFTFTLFGGYGLFTLGGLCVSNFILHERSVGRISLARGHDTISVLLGEARQGAAGWTWETDADGRLACASPQFAALLGTDDAALRGRTLSGLIGRAADPDARNADLAHALGTRAAFRELTVTAAVAGETRWWSLSGHPLDHGGTFVGFRGIGTDITERRRSDARMQALATRDSLTGIFNRQALLDSLEIACAQARTGAPRDLLRAGADRSRPLQGRQRPLRPRHRRRAAQIRRRPHAPDRARRGPGGPARRRRVRDHAGARGRDRGL